MVSNIENKEKNVGSQAASLTDLKTASESSATILSIQNIENTHSALVNQDNTTTINIDKTISKTKSKELQDNLSSSSSSSSPTSKNRNTNDITSTTEAKSILKKQDFDIVETSGMKTLPAHSGPLYEIPPPENRDPFLTIDHYKFIVESNLAEKKRKDERAASLKQALAYDNRYSMESDVANATKSKRKQQKEKDEENQEQEHEEDAMDEKPKLDPEEARRERIAKWEEFSKAKFQLHDGVDTWDSKDPFWFQAQITDFIFTKPDDDLSVYLTDTKGEVKVKEKGFVEALVSNLAKEKSTLLPKLKSLNKASIIRCCDYNKMRPGLKELVCSEVNKMHEIKDERLSVIKIHFMGWHAKHDKWVMMPSDEEIAKLISGMESYEHYVAPCNMYSDVFRASGKTKVKAVPESATNMDDEDSAEEDKLERFSKGHAELDASNVFKTTTRSGLVKNSSVPSLKNNRRAVVSSSSNSRQVTNKAAVPSKKLQGDGVHCTLCHKYQLVDSTQFATLFVECGNERCFNRYHIDCVASEKNGETSDEQFICDECESDSHECSKCKEYGQSDDLIQCCVPKCSNFYHADCLEEEDGCRVKRNEEEEVTSYKCPAHECKTCRETKTKVNGKLYRCLNCPTAYHSKCIPPNCRQKQDLILCAVHSSNPFPPFVDENGEPLEDEAQPLVDVSVQDVMKRIHVPQRVPQLNDKLDSNHFRLPRQVLSQVESRPPQFQTIRRNHYVNCSKLIDKDEHGLCKCTMQCDDKCHNRDTRVECFGENVNCPLGPECSNRALQKHKFKKTKPISTPGLGWGLKVMEDCRAGDFVIEYVGEVVTTDESFRRLADQARRNDRHVFHMELTNNRVLDARYKGNVSRFINHSCDPNCELQKWKVNGETRIAIVAIKDMVGGTELTYDYQFHSAQEDLKCLCKAPTCRGTLQPVSLADIKQQESAAKRETLLKLAAEDMKRNNGLLSQTFKNKLEKQKREQDRKATERELKKRSSALVRLSLTASTLPGDKGRYVKNGPVLPLHYFQNEEITSRCLLKRNAIAGSNFLLRQQLMESRVRHKRSLAQFVNKEVKSNKSKKNLKSTTSSSLSSSFHKRKADSDSSSRKRSKK